MLELLLLDLQLFADGGDGGAAGEGAVGSETTGADIPAAIPERAKERYKKAVEINKPTVQTTTEKNVAINDKKSYADLIKSDEYKEEHQQYMEKTIGDRLKKYKNVEAENAQMKGLLETVAAKYGVDAARESFLADLTKKIDEDNSYYENYAIEHDISPEEARKIVTMERKIQAIEAQKQEQQRQEAMQQQIAILRQNAERTKARFPDFDLDTEMQDEKFRKLCAVNNGDTTAAYMACHWDKVVPGMVHTASQQVAVQTAQAVAANKARPVENGISGNASSVVTQDFSKMSLKELRAYAEEQRRKQQGR